MTTAFCTRCTTTKPKSEFSPAPRNNSGVSSWCRDCTNEQRRDSYKSDSKKARRSRLKYFFGLTMEEYDAMLEAQGGVCAVCGRPERHIGNHGKVKNLAVDHDHESGRVRGLLCQDCNRGIGMLGDDPDRLRAAIAYLCPIEEALR